MTCGGCVTCGGCSCPSSGLRSKDRCLVLGDLGSIELSMCSVLLGVGGCRILGCSGVLGGISLGASLSLMSCRGLFLVAGFSSGDELRTGGLCGRCVGRIVAALFFSSGVKGVDFLRNFRFLTVTLPEPSTLITYWSY